MYNIKVTSGDASKPFVNSLTVNGTPLFTNVFLAANQFDTKDVDINVSDGVIVIEANCDDNNPPGHCKNVWSRMNTVEIT
jgi:hypothetical protein